MQSGISVILPRSAKSCKIALAIIPLKSYNEEKSKRTVVMSFTETDKKYRCDSPLGAFLQDDSTSFSVWAPEADSVELKLYSNQSDAPCDVIPMERCGDGAYRYVYPKRLDGLYYTYSFTYNGVSRECADVYAKAVGVNGERGYIADFSRTNPAGWDFDSWVRLDSPTDAVVCELSVRDFSADKSSGIPQTDRGRFGAFCYKNTRLPSGEPTCIGHLKKLGVTHVQLMPVFDFEGVDERTPRRDYNWGYNPANYNVPDGSLSSDPYDPERRIREFKELVHALHSEGIGVIMDVVYNHTYRTEDSCFGITYPGYYYRQSRDGGYSNGSGCGNEIASERAMVRKYIVDSVLWWAREYKIDGFRFDLMAVLDIDTVNEAARKLKELNPSAIVYGEGWSGGSIALSEEKSASKHNARYAPAYAFFNDGYRDAIKGDTFSDSGLGYISGSYHFRQSVINGLLGSAGWAGSPCQIINYCEVHDNLTLWDKLSISVGGCHDEDKKKMARLAMALVILAQGIPLIQCGQEFLRSKPLGRGFDHNSYRSPDSVNSIKWYLLDNNRRESDYCAGLIAFRRAHPLLRLRSFWDIEHSASVLSSPDGTIAIRLSGSEEILILVNPIPRAKMFILPDGEWLLHISDIAASDTPLATYCEGVVVPPISAMVLIKKI